MAQNRNRELVEAGIRVFVALPVPARIGLVVVLVAAGWAVMAVVGHHLNPTVPPAGAPVPPGAVSFMFWNVENLFDDRDDKRNSTDNPYDDWFAQDEAARVLKFERLCDIILRQNGGKGPDVLACVEVESLRAAELLRDALNARLPAGAPKYEHVVMKELHANAGRYMAPCVVSRLPLDPARTKLLGANNLRVLKTHVVADGADLTLVVSHWTSQRSDDGSRKGSGRDKYASTIHDDYRAAVADNPDVDYLVCGDFNDDPDSDGVANVLKVTADKAAVTRGADRLFGLLSGKPLDRFSTIYYDRDHKASIFDQIALSPGLLDDAKWGCDVNSVAVPTEGMSRAGKVARRPWRFGDRDDRAVNRGYADHFPVVVNLTLAP